MLTSRLLNKIVVLITYILMIAVNIAANTIPINGVTTGQVSNSYPNLFTPAAYTFAIWGLIYVLLAMYTIYQFVYKDTKNNDLLNKVGVLFSFSSVANALWILAWHNFMIPFTMILMAVILVCLILISGVINSSNLSTLERIFIRLPFSVYFGWITVATIANATTLLVSLGWESFGICAIIWTIVVLIIGMVIGTSVINKYTDFAYGLTLIWAYYGILVKHISNDEFNGQYPLIIATVIVCIIIFIVTLVNLFIVKKNKML